MNKRQQREEKNRLDAEKRRKTVMRNWIIAIVSLLLAIFCYLYLDGIIANFSGGAG